jgi:hypothetical protein
VGKRSGGCDAKRFRSRARRAIPPSTLNRPAFNAFPTKSGRSVPSRNDEAKKRSTLERRQPRLFSDGSANLQLSGLVSIR